MLSFVGLGLALQALIVSQVAAEVCPSVDCPVAVPADCAINQFVIGTDGQTRCRLCDKNICDPNACQKFANLTCPNEADIPPLCRKSQFAIGSDNMTKCRVCDINVCQNRMETCLQQICSWQPIPVGCALNWNIIGDDGITICPLCPTNICEGP